MENFLNHGSETKRSLSDSWYLTGDLLFEPDVLLQTIMLKAGECATVFANAATMYNMTRMWWEKHRLTFQKWWEVIDDPYNPMWTNDFTRTFTETRRTDGSSSTRTSGAYEGKDDRSNQGVGHDWSTDSTNGQTKTLSHDNTTKDQSKGETENGVSAYDSGSYSPHDISESRSAHTAAGNADGDAVSKSETVHNGGHTNGDTSVGHNSGTNTGASDTVTGAVDEHTSVEHLEGNSSALMTGQRLLEDEIKVRRLNLYDMMADLFCDEMLIWVYV